MKRLIALLMLATLVLSAAAVGVSASGQSTGRATLPAAVEANDAPAAAPAIAPAAEPATISGGKADSEDNTHRLVPELLMDAQSVQARKDSEAQDITCPGKDPCGE